MRFNRVHDPVARQADALRNLWGPTAGEVAGRYLSDARKLGKAERIEFWEQVVRGLDAPAATGTAS